ncbi:hypothetical protein SDC9_153605 [bioreactor metagenome]|uniref:Inner membrane protein YdjM n=1 Tax=bioreactor metagenome TaxID=1076179 RepID=A0A645EYT8_9ZZZZ
MNYQVHTVGALASAYGIIEVSSKIGIKASPLVFIAGALLGGLLPDIDNPDSKIGRLFILSGLIYKKFGHRYFFHSLLFVFITGALLSLFDFIFGAGVMIGMLSHLILDLIGLGNGVALLYPLNKNKISIRSTKHNKKTNI